LYSGANAVGIQALNTGSNIITDILNKISQQSVDKVFKNRFSQAKGNLEEKVKMMMVRVRFKKEKKKNSQSHR